MTARQEPADQRAAQPALRRIRVLQSVARPGTTVKFIDQVVRYAPSDIVFEYFSWPRAIFGAYDVLHVHWPEYFTRGSSAIATRVKRLLFRALLIRIRWGRTRVVRTVHNVRPHAPGDTAEAELLERLDAATTLDVRLNECTPSRGIPSVVIPHGDYREQFSGLPWHRPVGRRVLFIGRVEEYKGVIDLIRLVQGMRDTEVELRIVGRASTDMREQIRRAIDATPAGAPPISTRLEFVRDDEMVREITESSVVVLPYREMHNSGILLVALSLGRPVLVPAGCVNDAIAREVGAEWVTQYSGPLRSSDVERALAASVGLDGRTPELSGRDWHAVAGAYAQVYRAEAVADRN